MRAISSQKIYFELSIFDADDESRLPFSELIIHKFAQFRKFATKFTAHNFRTKATDMIKAHTYVQGTHQNGNAKMDQHNFFSAQQNKYTNELEHYVWSI